MFSPYPESSEELHTHVQYAHDYLGKRIGRMQRRKSVIRNWSIAFKVARDSCDVTHSLKQASIHTSHVHA